jgi:hypothetical protein
VGVLRVPVHGRGHLPQRRGARQLVAAGSSRASATGIGNDPYGFFDASGLLLEFLKGPKYSLLYFWDTPRAMWVQMLAFYAVTVAFMVGWKTRLMGVLSASC